MKNKYFHYTLRELSRRKKAAFSVFIVMTTAAFVLFSLSMMSFSSYSADCLRYDQAGIYGLTKADTTALKGMDFVQESSSHRSADGTYTVFLKFTDGNPLRIEEQCNRVIESLGYPTYGDGIHTDSPYGSVAEQYYDLTVTPYLLKNIPFMGFFYLLTGPSVCMALSIRNTRSAREYGYMRTLGFRKSEILLLSLMEPLMLYGGAVACALLLSVPVSALLCALTQWLYVGDYQRMAFAVSWPELFSSVVLMGLVILIFQLCHVGGLLKSEIICLVHGDRSGKLAFVESSSPIMEGEDKLRAYNKLYLRRSYRHLVGKLCKTVVLYLLPAFLLLFSVTYNESRVGIVSETDYVLSPLGGRVTDGIAEEAEGLASVKEVKKIHMYEDGTYSLLELICHDGMEEECQPLLEEMAERYSLYLTDHHHQRITLVAQANIFAPYYLIQAIIMFCCGLLIVGADLVYELSSREKEFAIIRAIGYSVQEVRRLLKPYRILAVWGYTAAVVIMILILGLGFDIWTTKLMLYPMLVVVGFGILNDLVHRILCNRFVGALESRELSSVLQDET